MALKANYRGIKKVTDNLTFTSDGILDVNVSGEVEENDTHAVGGGAVYEELAKKQPTYTADPESWDTTPTQNSTKPVTSGGAYNGVKAVRQQIEDTVGWLSENLVGAVTLDHSINAEGIESSSSTGFEILEYMSVMPLDKYIFSGYHAIGNSTNIRVHGYDLNGDWIKQILVYSLAGTRAFEIPITVDDTSIKYVRISLTQEVSDLSFKHITVDEQKCDNSVIAPVEDGTNASQAYALNDLFIRDGHLCKTTTAMAQGDALAGKYAVTSVAEILTAFLNS